MSDKSGIEWTDATWNPVTGCTKVSNGCKFCYAKHKMWPRLSAIPNSVYTGREFEQVMTHPERLDQPLHWTKPRMIFVNSMSDLFHEDVPFDFIDKVFAVMALAQQHTFQVLTKRAARMLEYLKQHAAGGRHIWPACQQIAMPRGQEKPSAGWPIPNVWLGVSVEDQSTAAERIPLLLQTPAAVRWVSAEPMLGPVDLSVKYLATKCGGNYPFKGLTTECRTKLIDLLDWVVVGGESGPNARPMHPDWARSLRDQCAAAGVPFLFKQWGEWAPEPDECDGTACRYMNHAWPDGTLAHRVGKKAAGRLLDGAQHDNYPKGGTP